MFRTRKLTDDGNIRRKQRNVALLFNTGITLRDALFDIRQF